MTAQIAITITVTVDLTTEQEAYVRENGSLPSDIYGGLAFHATDATSDIANGAFDVQGYACYNSPDDEEPFLEVSI